MDNTDKKTAIRKILDTYDRPRIHVDLNKFMLFLRDLALVILCWKLIILL